MPSSPAGVLMLAPEREPLEPAVREIGADCPELEARLLDPDGRAGAGAGRGARAVGVPARDRLPGAADRRHARVRAARSRGRRALPRGGDRLAVGGRGARRAGVLSAGRAAPAGAVIVAAGPWTPEVIDPTRGLAADRAGLGRGGRRGPSRPARHVLEEAGVEGVAAGADGRRRAVQPRGRRRARVARLDVPARPPEPRAVGGPAAPGGRPLRAGAQARRGGGPPDLRAAAVRRRAAAPRRGARRRRASGSPRVTARGGSRPARRAPASWRTLCSGGPRSPSRCR